MTTATKHYEIVIVGAGPAGIMAAIWAARAGKSVALLEKNDHLGRKILATGNGRCNITNRHVDASRYHGTDVSFVESIFDNFNQNDTINFFESLGVSLKEEDRGRLFPQTDKADTVVDSLRAELARLNVDILTSFTVKKIVPPCHPEPCEGSRARILDSSVQPQNDNAWEIYSDDSKTITADKLILTTGGKAAHALGSSGDGLFWAQNLGHTIVPIHAALVPIETKETFVKEIMGIKLPVRTSLISSGKVLEIRQGDLLFTHFGISGPAAMGLAGRASQLIASGTEAIVSIDLLPSTTDEELDATVMSLMTADGKKAIKTIVASLLPQKLAPQILASARIKDSTKAAEISKSQRHAIARTIKDFRLTVSKVRPLKEAQVTAGGVATAEIDENLKSKLVPNLYFAGEILDIDGDSGGFNLQWAWSSGKVAGESVTERR